MFYERYAGKIAAELSGVVLSIGLINLTYDLSRDSGVMHRLDWLDLGCLLAMIALTCAFAGYHTLAFRIDMALPGSEEDFVAELSATRVIALYLIDLSSLAALAGMFGVLPILGGGTRLEPNILALSAVFAGTWHALMVLWYIVRCGKIASNARYHAGFALWYGSFAGFFHVVEFPALPGIELNLYPVLWVFGFATGVGLLYFGRFRKTVARGARHFAEHDVAEHDVAEHDVARASASPAVPGGQSSGMPTRAKIGS